jgi:hypothetical protein
MESTDQKPPLVATFESALMRNVEFLKGTVKLSETHAAPQPAWFFLVEGGSYPSNVIVHQTAESLGTSEPVYRVRSITEIEDEMGAWFEDKNSIANRFASLGAVIGYKGKVSISSQGLIDERNVELISALFAPAAIFGADSLLQSVKNMFHKPDEPVHVTSAWTELEFENIRYDRAHLSSSSMGRDWLRINSMDGVIELKAVHNNPYWQGGLLILARVPKASLDIADEAPIQEMNLLETSLSEIPVFGGWSEGDEHLNFVTFLPNFLKGVPKLEEFVINCAERRLSIASALVKSANEVREEAGSPSGEATK